MSDYQLILVTVVIAGNISLLAWGICVQMTDKKKRSNRVKQQHIKVFMVGQSNTWNGYPQKKIGRWRIFWVNVKFKLWWIGMKLKQRL